MSSQHRTPDAVLQAWLAGEMGDDEARRALAGAPEVRAQMDELAALRAALDTEAETERRATLEEARTESFPRGEELARRFVRERLPAAQRRPPAPILVLVAAAAAVLLFVWSPWRASPDPEGGPTVLDGNGLRDLEPCDTTVEAWGEFRWKASLTAGYTFEVDVFAADDPTGDPLEHVEGLTAQSWRPSASQVERWPSRIVWIVRVVNSFRTTVAQERCTVSLSQ